MEVRLLVVENGEKWREGRKEKKEEEKKGGGQREREPGGASLGEKAGCWEAFTSSRLHVHALSLFSPVNSWPSILVCLMLEVVSSLFILFEPLMSFVRFYKDLQAIAGARSDDLRTSGVASGPSFGGHGALAGELLIEDNAQEAQIHPPRPPILRQRLKGSCRVAIEQTPQTPLQLQPFLLFIMSDTFRFYPSLTPLLPTTPRGSSRILQQFSIPGLSISDFPRKSLNFPQKIGVSGGKVWALAAWNQEGPLQDLDDSPVSVELKPISSDTQFDRILGEAQQLEESVAIVWYVYCIWPLTGFSAFV
ncbi:Thioredoxin-like 3-2, chloroplastic [Vitis vinifera]|uniref:Thioredoxin-like 3-2, chloroplastic n=1 Tax=Vitis vinifera TaxID=29760 RepID=A0A438GPP1_VITVI|nr:Thioredoxin-like 3-2, chloroplastic [Vitis vinifera]